MTTQKSDEHFLALALQEAQKAYGRTSPNPCVGAVIVKNDLIIATGYHEKAGSAHAEINALTKAGDESKGATLYVTLEPCNHTGKTPPCSHAVVKSGIGRVVIGMLDPNPLVSGSGRRYLIDHHIEVTTGVLEQECKKINEPFIKHITTGLPLVNLKAGLSLDGRLNYIRGKGGWITGAESFERVHQMRDRTDAILVGRNTVAIDNPSLTTRLSASKGRDPVRVILDTGLSLSKTAKIFHLTSESPTWIFCSADVSEKRMVDFDLPGVTIFPIPCNKEGSVDLHSVLKTLGAKGILSVLVEGGGRVHSSFLKDKLADRMALFYAPIFAGGGGDPFLPDLSVADKKEAIRLADINYIDCGEDRLLEGMIKYPNPHFS